MRFLHTSDWHLGKTLHGHDLAEAQQVAMEAVVDLAIDREVDVVVIAGDVYDRAFPGVEDVRRLNSALTRIHEAGIHIICTAGNHDEGARLAALANLLDDRVTVVGEYAQVGDSVTLRDDFGVVAFYPFPYLHPDGARRALAADDSLLERSHEAVIGEAMRRVRTDLDSRRASDPALRAVVVAHAFIVRGGETAEELMSEQSESERDLSVGGVPSAPTALFDGVHYVALGHLHGPRTVQSQDPPAGRPLIRYSGSPLRYSLSEAGHVKTVSIVEIDSEGRCTVEEVPVPQPAGMARLRGDLDELLSDAYSAHHDDYVEIVVTDSHLPDNWLAQLTQRFSRILKTRHDRSPVHREPDSSNADGIRLVTPLETLRNFYVAARLEEPTPTMVGILTSALEKAQQKAEI